MRQETPQRRFACAELNSWNYNENSRNLPSLRKTGVIAIFRNYGSRGIFLRIWAAEMTAQHSRNETVQP